MANIPITTAAARREYRLLAGLLGFFAVIYFCLSASDATPLLDGDDAVYMLMADHFSPFSTRSREITDLVMRHSLFPPLYPMLLGLLGATSAQIQLAHVVTLGFLAGGFVLYFFWLRSVFPERATAFLLLIVFAFLPATVFQSFGLLSENLYLMLTLGALLCANHAGKHDVFTWTAAAAVGLSAVTRSAGVVLVLAYLVHLARSPDRYRAWLVALCVVPFLAWMAWKWVMGYHGSYAVSFYGILSTASFSEFLVRQLGLASRELTVAWAGALNHLSSPFFVPLALVFGFVGVVGAIWRAATMKLDGLYVTAYSIMILAWPYSYEARRFVYVIVPILLAQGLWAVAELSRRSGRVKAVTAVVAGYMMLLGVVVFPATGAVALRAMATLEAENRGHGVTIAWYAYPDLARAKHRETEQLALTQAWSGLAAYVPGQECVYHIKPAAMMLYADRLSYATPHADSAADYLGQASRCRFFYVGAYVYAPYRGAFFPLKLLGRRARVVKVDYIDEESGRRPLGMLLRVVDQGSRSSDQMDVARAVDLEYRNEDEGRPSLGMLVKYEREQEHEE